MFERVQAIGYQKCQGLLGFHKFSGVDRGGKFVGITNKTWANAYLKLDDNDPAIQCFKELCEGSIQSELINDEVPIKVKALEHFVCCQLNKSNNLALTQMGTIKKFRG